jgi:hypothetical protein
MRSAIASIAVIGVVLGSASASPAATTCSFTSTMFRLTLEGYCASDETILIPNGIMLDGASYTTAVKSARWGFRRRYRTERRTIRGRPKPEARGLDRVANVCDAEGDRLGGILFDSPAGSSRTTSR